ncbi:MAG: aspartate 1-decarboxylase [Kosmotogaceae bacterium]
MFRVMYKSKIHRARITEKELYYEGSITIDENLMELAGMRENEMVQVVNMENGSRLETYIIKGKYGSGIIGLNGPAARLGELGDQVIIISYGIFSEEEIEKPRVVHVDENNKPVK